MDYTIKCGVYDDRPLRLLFSQTADKSVVNTTTETSLIGTGVGSVVIPAYALRDGDILRFRGSGLISTTGTPTSTLKIKFGSTTLITSTLTLSAVIANSHEQMDFDLAVRGTTLIGQGLTVIREATGTVFAARGLIMTTPATVDLTIANTMDVTYTWGTASTSNYVTSTNATLELIRPII